MATKCHGSKHRQAIDGIVSRNGAAVTTVTTVTNENQILYFLALSVFCQDENAPSRTETKIYVVTVVTVVTRGEKARNINGFFRYDMWLRSRYRWLHPNREEDTR